MSADVSEAVREEVRKTLSWFAGEIGAAERGNPRTRKARKLHLIGEATNMVVGLAALQEGSGALPASPSVPAQPLEPLLAELERLALAATPGPWADGPPAWFRGRKSEEDGKRPIQRPGHPGTMANVYGKENAAFIAAANPATVLKLIAAVRASEVGMEPKAECTQPNQPRDREEG